MRLILSYSRNYSHFQQYVTLEIVPLSKIGFPQSVRHCFFDRIFLVRTLNRAHFERIWCAFPYSIKYQFTYTVLTTYLPSLIPPVHYLINSKRIQFKSFHISQYIKEIIFLYWWVDRLLTELNILREKNESKSQESCFTVLEINL